MAEYERAVIFRLGRLRKGGSKGPGIFTVIPCIDTYRCVDLRTVSFDVPPQEVSDPDLSVRTCHATPACRGAKIGFEPFLASAKLRKTSQKYGAHFVTGLTKTYTSSLTTLLDREKGRASSDLILPFQDPHVRLCDRLGRRGRLFQRDRCRAGPL